MKKQLKIDAMPVITDFLDKLGKATYFSDLDLASGYYQIEMVAEDMAKTANLPECPSG